MEELANLKERMNKITKELEEIIMILQKEGIRDTQEALNFMDKINELSVSF